MVEIEPELDDVDTEETWCSTPDRFEPGTPTISVTALEYGMAVRPFGWGDFVRVVDAQPAERALGGAVQGGTPLLPDSGFTAVLWEGYHAPGPSTIFRNDEVVEVR